MLLSFSLSFRSQHPLRSHILCLLFALPSAADHSPTLLPRRNLHGSQLARTYYISHCDRIFKFCQGSHSVPSAFRKMTPFFVGFSLVPSAGCALVLCFRNNSAFKKTKRRFDARKINKNQRMMITLIRQFFLYARGCCGDSLDRDELQNLPPGESEPVQRNDHFLLQILLRRVHRIRFHCLAQHG